MDTMKRGKVTCTNITSLSMMEECGNKNHNDNNKKETDTSLDTNKKPEEKTQIYHPQA